MDGDRVPGMPDLPGYPDPGVHHDDGPTSARRSYAPVVLIGVLIALFVVLHLTGVIGPARHAPTRGTPPASTDPQR